jgi:hypothetical protein
MINNNVSPTEITIAHACGITTEAYAARKRDPINGRPLFSRRTTHSNLSALEVQVADALGIDPGDVAATKAAHAPVGKWKGVTGGRPPGTAPEPDTSEDDDAANDSMNLRAPKMRVLFPKRAASK